MPDRNDSSGLRPARRDARRVACFLAVGTIWAAGCGRRDLPPTGNPALPNEPTAASNLVIVSFDTVRRDHLSAYGYHRATSPSFDALAASGTLFLDAVTQDTNTGPAHASLFTGRYPHEHGVEVNGHLLPAEDWTIARELRKHGYATAAFVGGAPLQAEACGLDAGFDTYDDEFSGRRRHGETVLSNALSWLSERPAEQRFFLFVHFWDAHGPYEPDALELERIRATSRDADRAPPTVELPRIPDYQLLTDKNGKPIRELSEYVDRYDALIARVDSLLGRLAARLDLSQTLLVVLADHGESLDERYWKLDHGAQLFDEQIRVPLLFVGPGVDADRVAGSVELVDVAPTALELLGIDSTIQLPEVEFEPASPSGRSFAAALRSTTRAVFSPKTQAFSSARADSMRHVDRGYQLHRLRKVFAARTLGKKLIAYPGTEGDYFELFDLFSDPAETINLANSRRADARELFAALEQWNPHRANSIGTISVSRELRDQLRSLGYLP